MGFDDERRDGKRIKFNYTKAKEAKQASLSHADDESMSDPEAELNMPSQTQIEDKPENETRYRDLVKDRRNVIGNGIAGK